MSQPLKLLGAAALLREHVQSTGFGQPATLPQRRMLAVAFELGALALEAAAIVSDWQAQHRRGDTRLDDSLRQRYRELHRALAHLADSERRAPHAALDGGAVAAVAYLLRRAPHPELAATVAELLAQDVDLALELTNPIGGIGVGAASNAEVRAALQRLKESVA